jgi:hypothetical protein
MSSSLRILPITAGVLTSVYGILALGVILLRRGESIALGTGDNKLMEYRVRGHSNFTENVPFALILLGIVEYNNYVPEWAVMALSSVLVVGRILHAYAFLYLHPIKIHLKYRAPGFAMTLSSIGISGTIALIGGVKRFLKI